MKSRGTLWKVSVTTTTEAEEAVTELLNEIFAQPVSSYTDVETREVTVATYLTDEDFQKRQRAAAVSRHSGTDALREGVRRIKECGLNVGSGKVLLQKIRHKDWAEAWKRHFKPIEIGSALLIKPSWAKRRPKKGQAVIVLDPGLSFGTGQHPTTGFCLRELGKNVAPLNAARTASRHGGIPTTRKSFLDVGTGSGILAIAAAKLGCAPVDAFDFDPEAVRVAKENARKNGVSRRVRITRADVTKLAVRSQKKYDVICANLISTLLVAEQKRILARLKQDGVLIIAGILASEFKGVEQTYESAGLKLVAARTEKEWRSGAFRYRR